MLNLSGMSVMQKTLDALWLRQRIISNNIANIDTPGYKSREVKFEEYLNNLTPSVMLKEKDVPDARIVTRNDTSLREDGNNVDIDKESLELYRVQIQYEYMVRKLSDEFSNIKTVLMEGRR
ncbi:MAG: flagellar basal body rod protein FlgB [Oscillospiraceae bacterium]|nr:flagellar basal body rod protein FlgB [Oscillospiraceae bacterium]